MTSTEVSVGRQRARAVHRVLKRKFQAAGRGSINRVEEQLGLSSGLIRSWRLRGDLRVSDLFDILDCLSIEPELFLIEVLDEGDIERFDGGERLLRSISPRGVPPQALREALTPNGNLGQAYLDQLSTRTPRQIVDGVLPRLGQFSPSTISAALSSLGTAWRRLDCISEAAHTLLLAARTALTDIDRAIALQKLTYVACSDFDFALASRLARASRELFLQSGLLGKVGQTFVDEGHALFCAKAWPAAKACFRYSLLYLDSDDTNNLMAAHHCIGHISLILGDTKEAIQSCRRAERLALKAPMARLKPKIFWLKANIALKQGERQKAANFLRTAKNLLMELSPIDAALISLDLIETLNSIGKFEEARKVAREMTRLVIPLAQKCKAAEVAAVRLIKAALEGRITEKEIGRARNVLEGSWRRAGEPSPALLRFA